MTRTDVKSDPDPGAPDADALRAMIAGYEAAQTVYVAAALGLADHLFERPRAAADLASALGADGAALERVLRALATLGIVDQQAGDLYGLTPLGALLRDGVPGSLRAAALLSGERSYRAWGGLAHSVRTGETAFRHVFGMGTFEYMAAHPALAAIYNEAMAESAASRAAAVARAYDFSRVQSVVDVGGGHGTLLAAILGAHAGLSGILLERESVAAGARARIEAAGLASRCQVVVGDFFERVPVGGDVYLLSHIIHNWDDARSRAILANCRAAMSPTGRILIVEQVLPERFQLSPAARRAAMADLHMLVVTGGRERTEGEYRALLAAAGFTLRAVIGTEAPECLLEAIP